ncbi:MAG: HAMP domain-containing sensor histidine kinase [Clostridia bacterium]|nr:HAMP domain-containing sensor histidine kinase [Clostridia bacterium]
MKLDSLKINREKYRLGIRSNIFLGFAAFAVIILVLLWVFQISMLNTFYRYTKEVEVKNTADEIIYTLRSEDYFDQIKEIARNKSSDILICNEYGIVEVLVTNVKSEVFDMLSPNAAALMYSQTARSGGSQLVEIPKQKKQKNESTNPSEGQIYQQHGNDNGNGNESLLYCKCFVNPAGESRMVAVNSKMKPVDATVSTLKIQLICLSFVMIILSFGHAIILSRKISRPIESINESAKELAQGNYSTEFEMSGSKETAELAGTLNIARDELSKVDDLRRELIANVSHDLRTPLTMIKGYSEVMRDIPGENTPENVQVIIDETERLSSLVNDLLDISKLESGNIELEKITMNLTQITESIMMRFEKLADYQFNFYHGKDVWVDADELKITQVIYNLINNAITYTGEDKRIDVVQTVENGKVKISVSDTGEGIPQDKLVNIWERYYKVDKAHKRAQRGTGLGLSIVKKILDLHGGSYGVVSTIGKGSTFWFELEVVEPKKEI